MSSKAESVISCTLRTVGHIQSSGKNNHSHANSSLHEDFTVGGKGRATAVSEVVIEKIVSKTRILRETVLDKRDL